MVTLKQSTKMLYNAMDEQNVVSGRFENNLIKTFRILQVVIGLAMKLNKKDKKKFLRCWNSARNSSIKCSIEMWKEIYYFPTKNEWIEAHRRVK